MQQCDMGVPRGARVDSQAQRMVAPETEVVRAARVDEREPTGRIGVPGVGRDLIERGLQLRGVDHERQIYGAPASWQLPTGWRRTRTKSPPYKRVAAARRLPCASPHVPFLEASCC